MYHNEYEERKLAEFLRPLMGDLQRYAETALVRPEDGPALTEIKGRVRTALPDVIYALLTAQMERNRTDGKAGGEETRVVREFMAARRPEIHARLLRNPQFEPLFQRMMGELEAGRPHALAEFRQSDMPAAIGKMSLPWIAGELATLYYATYQETIRDEKETLRDEKGRILLMQAESRKGQANIRKELAMLTGEKPEKRPEGPGIPMRGCSTTAVIFGHIALGIGIPAAYFLSRGQEEKRPDPKAPPAASAPAVEKLRQEKEAAPMRRQPGK